MYSMQYTNRMQRNSTSAAIDLLSSALSAPHGSVLYETYRLAGLRNDYFGIGKFLEKG